MQKLRGRREGEKLKKERRKEKGGRREGGR